MGLRDFGLLVLICLVWAINNILTKYVLTDLHVPPFFFAAVRFAFLLAMVWPWVLPMPRPSWRIIAVGLLMGAVNLGFYFVGLRTATPSAAAVVLLLGMPMTILMSVLFLGEQVRWRRLLGIVLTFAGALLVMWDPHGLLISFGLLMVAGCALACAVGAILMKQLQGVKPLQYQAWVGFTSLWPLVALSAFTEHGQLELVRTVGLQLAGAALFTALAASLLAHSVYYILVQRYEANLIAALSLMTPLATIGLGVAILDDPFGPRMAIGSALALAGVLIIALRGGRVWPMLLAIRGRAP